MQIVADRAEGEVRPRVFFEDFPNMVLYVREIPQSGGWQDVLAADTSNPAQPVLFLAAHRPDAGGSPGPDHPDGAAGRRPSHHQAGRSDSPTRCSIPADGRVAESRRASFRDRSGPRRPRADASQSCAQRVTDLEAAGGVDPQPDHGDPQEVLHSGRVLRLRAARPRARRQQPQGRQAGRASCSASASSSSTT